MRLKIHSIYPADIPGRNLMESKNIVKEHVPSSLSEGLNQAGFTN